MKNNTRINLVIITFINWSISLFVNETYNHISAIIHVASLIYLLINVESMGYKWEPIDFSKLFKKDYWKF